MLTADNASIYTDFNGLAKLKQQARDQSPEAIKEVAKQFESVFLNMVFKTMREAKLSSGILDSQQTQFYQEMYDQQLALHLAGKPGIGLADVIAKQLSPQPAKADDADGLTLEDYLDQAKAAIAPASPNQDQSRSPLSAAGLIDLERRLALLERHQQRQDAQMQAIAADWPVNDADDADDGKQQFISQLWPHAQQAARELGVDPKLLIAQAALETGWGQAVIKTPQGGSSFNLFNIKADKSWQGKQAKALTVEFDGHVAKKESAGFRAYQSYRDSFNDYADFIKTNPRYGAALKNVSNPGRYMSELQQAGYATDPNFADKVMTIYHGQLRVGNTLALANTE